MDILPVDGIVLEAFQLIDLVDRDWPIAKGADLQFVLNLNALRNGRQFLDFQVFVFLLSDALEDLLLAHAHVYLFEEFLEQHVHIRVEKLIVLEDLADLFEGHALTVLHQNLDGVLLVLAVLLHFFLGLQSQFIVEILGWLYIFDVDHGGVELSLSRWVVHEHFEQVIENPQKTRTQQFLSKVLH